MISNESPTQHIIETYKRNGRKKLTESSAVAPEQTVVEDLITATESAIRNNKLADTEAEQLQLKVSAALANTKAHPSNFTTEERKASVALTILLSNKGRCTVVPNTPKSLICLVILTPMRL